MTEKRFEIKKSAIIDGARVIKDNEKKYTFATTFETATLINYKKALNELNDENEKLKQLIEDKNQIQQETLQQLVQTQKELQTIKNTIKEMHKNERTHLGHNVLSQLIEAIQ